MLRIVYIANNQSLRIVSAVIRAFDFADEVLLFDLSSSDSTPELAKEAGAEVISLSHNPKHCFLPTMAKVLLDQGNVEKNLVINLDSKWSLRNLPRDINRANEDWDLYVTSRLESNNELQQISFLEELTYEQIMLQIAIISTSAMEELSNCGLNDKPSQLSKKLSVRVLEEKGQYIASNRESLATASRFAQLFYWMLESKHPLLLFGIPGIVCFVIGYVLSRDVLDNFQSINSTSLGVALATFAVTFIGLFSIMAAIVLYILGKQVKQIQFQYDDWPR